MAFKIISFNIGMGADRNEDNKLYLLELNNTIPYILSFIKDELLESVNEKAVICLQEVDFKMSRSGNKNFLKALKTTLGPTWDYFYFDPSNETDQRYGIGIMTNLPGTLPNDKTKEQKWKIYAGEGEQRGAIALKLSFENNPFWIVNTHLGFINQPSQVDKIIERVYTFDHACPVIICGDFNISDLDYEHGKTGKNHAVYQQTIKKLERDGFFKSEIQNNPPQTFHSWNSKVNGRVIDYIMTSYPYPLSTIAQLKCYQSVHSKKPAFTFDSKKYYASDHNAVIMKYSFPDFS
jgi:endonuclease/exonuclease/phosphatase family metal-dependent hydrolase